MRHKLLSVVAAATLVLPPAGAQAQAAPAPAAPHLTLTGLISSTLFLQDHSFGFGNGQSTSWAAHSPRSGDPWFLGGDVRNTRIALDIAAPEPVGGWSVAGRVEIDFFGGFNGVGAFSDEQPHPRLRQTYVELARGASNVRIGQAASPLCGLVPVSVSHIAFPLGLGSAGVIGWRFPGLFATHRLHRSDPLTVQLQGAVMRGSWDGPGNNLDHQSAGETAAIPQLQGRLDLTGRTQSGIRWTTYVVGHFDRKDLSGTDVSMNGDDDLTGTAVQVGSRVVAGPLTLQGNAYRGRAIGHQFGQLTQFGDVRGWGAWGQAGYALGPTWSVWAFAGMDDPRDDDLEAVPGRVRTRNASHAAMLRHTMGPVAVGVEWFQARTDWREEVGEPPIRRRGNQFALSALYQF